MTGRRGPSGPRALRENDVLLLASLALPVVVLGHLALTSWLVAVVGAGVALAVGGMVLWRTGDALVAVVAGGVSPLLLSDVPGVLGGVGLMVGLALMGVAGNPWPLLLSIGGVFVSASVGSAAVAMAVVGLWLAPRAGAWERAAALALAVLAVVLTRSPVPLAGLAVAVPLRWLATHPARGRVGGTVRDVGLVAAAAPAALFLVVGAVGQGPSIGGDALVGGGWGLVGIGVVAFFGAVGLQWLFRAVPPDAEVVVGDLVLATLGVVYGIAAQGLEAGAGVVALGWMVASYPVALGLRRVLGVSGRWRLFVVLGFVLVAAVAGAVRLLFE